MIIRRITVGLAAAALTAVSVTGCHFGASVNSNPGIVISHTTPTPSPRGASPSAPG
jgi:hypothetical protein